MLALIIAIIAFAVYYLYLLIFWNGLVKRREIKAYKKKKVSVVIAARNEENNISQLLTTLVNQSYSKSLYEIIIANDDSTDKTAEIVSTFAKRWPIIKLLKVKNRSNVKSPKKNALEQAIAMSGGEIILSTDADCLVGKYWIESMVANYEPDIHMVVGFSRTKLNNFHTSSLVRKFEHFDCNSMFSANAGAVSSGKYFSCSGQNISYRKSAFESVGGFEEIKEYISGDDVNLMQLFRKQGFKIHFAFSDHSFVVTKPVDNWPQLFNQRSRWASNMKLQIHLNPEFFFYLVTAFISTMAPLILLFFSPITAIAIVVIRMIGEYKFLQTSFGIFRIEKKMLKFYPLWFILQPVYMIIVASFGFLNIFHWKK